MLTLLSEIWMYLKDKYFSVDFTGYNYEHVRLGETSFFSLQAIIIALFLGVIVAAGTTLYQKRTLGELIRALDRADAYDADRARTLGELGLLQNYAIKNALRRQTVYGQFVQRVTVEPELTDKGKAKPAGVDLTTDRFYIPEQKVFSALSHFDKKGSNPAVFWLTVVLCIVLASVCCSILPDLLQMADNMIGNIKGA